MFRHKLRGLKRVTPSGALISSGAGAGKPLHTDSLKNPYGATFYFAPCSEGAKLRGTVIGDENKTGRVPKYVALSRVFTGRFPEIDTLMEENPHRLMGRTFRQESTGQYQNRLYTRQIRWFLLPKWLRSKVSDQKDWWLVEVYNFYGKRPVGRLKLYAFVVELSPAPRLLPDREALGSEKIWRMAGRHSRFSLLLRVQMAPRLMDRPVLAITRVVGAVAAAVKTMRLIWQIARVQGGD